MNKTAIAVIVIILFIAAGIGIYFILQNPSSQGKCGDGICGAKEKANSNLCPGDCGVATDGNVSVGNIQKINVLVIVHTGEGGEKGCEMSRASLTDTNYIRCRDGLKTVASELNKGGIPATFEFLGPFADLLSKDTNFSFDRDILSKGHSIGFHGHSHCYYNGTFGSAGCKEIDLENKLFWGEIGQDQSPTIEELLARIDSARIFNKYSDIGSMHGMAYQYKQDSNALISEMDKRGILIWTSTKAVFSDYPENSSCNNAKILLSPHPITPAAAYSNVVYFDHGPAKGDSDMFGSSEFKLDALTSRFEELIKCRQEEQSKANPYVFAEGTHLWNIITNEDENPSEYDGISDIKAFKQWIDMDYGEITIFSKIENVYEDFIKEQR